VKGIDTAFAVVHPGRVVPNEEGLVAFDRILDKSFWLDKHFPSEVSWAISAAVHPVQVKISTIALLWPDFLR